MMLREIFWKIADILHALLSGAGRLFADSRLREPILKTATAGMAFLSVTVAAIAADNKIATWTIWLPLLFALLAVAPGLLDRSAIPHAEKILLALILVLALISFRLIVAFLGPLPYLAFRDAIEIFAAFMAGLALWTLAGKNPTTAYAVWIAALLIALVARWRLSSFPSLFRPDLLPLIVSIPWAFIALGGILAQKSERREPTPRSALAILFIHSIALAVGGFSAWLCVTYAQAKFSGPLASQTALARGMETLALLWSKSVLLGWGRSCMARLAGVLGEPLPSEFPPWLGWTGSLANGGLAAILGTALLAVGLAWFARMKSGVHRLTSAPQLALLAAQALLVLHARGGPNSTLPFLIIACWIGLGFAPVPIPSAVEETEPGRFTRSRKRKFAPGSFVEISRLVCAGATIMLLIAVGLVSLGPVWSVASLSGIRIEQYRNPDLNKKLSRKIYWAKSLFPWDPQIEVKEAMRLREELQRTPISQWNETLYRRACDAYLRAEELDPYDPLIALDLARLEKTAGRADDAAKTVLRALAITPSSEVLIEWLCRHAVAVKKTELAREMVDRGLKLHPESAKWWRWRYELDHLVGRGPQAGLALNVALTANPSSAELVEASFARNTTAGMDQPLSDTDQNRAN